ncbi:E3 ubiquitin-protein ligase RNF19B-like isoform X4 [Dromaius novaehollandiae]
MKINDGSCNRVSCTVCGCLLCWLCLREISDVRFLSPSGCTFWGKRPWSRSRKIPWQLGLVLGAPMAVSLAAGVAVPVIAIGIPVYMRRKVLGRSGKSSVSGCQSVTSSVLLSLFVSPIITGRCRHRGGGGDRARPRAEPVQRPVGAEPCRGLPGRPSRARAPWPRPRQHRAGAPVTAEPVLGSRPPLTQRSHALPGRSWALGLGAPRAPRAGSRPGWAGARGCSAASLQGHLEHWHR